ncbi:MAG: S49 family peptidase [Burkholderiales bacterium]|nr:S49 family peptidase [Burkholderiales bacterium]OJX08145.1 MAG: S49 family peptidase [Burkholderiales bacterium 70-64]
MNDADAPAGAGNTGARPEAMDARWQREVLEKLLLGTLQEKRRARRWGIFFKLLTFAWLAAALLVAGGWLVRDAKVSVGRHTALVDLDGVIAAESEASAEDIIASLRSAFEDHNTAGIVLRINSPGGSPVQAGMIADEIRRLRAKYPDTPLYAVVEEVCASGGYYVAAAADRIYVDKASLVGSIGVLMDGFGFVGTMDKLGVERRLITSGRNKGFLDSFSPLPEEQRQYAQSMLDEIHQQFIDVVRRGRGERLKDVPDLFSGLVWTGARSIEIGLSDGLGTVDSVARDVIKAEEVVDFSARKNLAERLARRFGASLGETMATALRASSSFHLR